MTDQEMPILLVGKPGHLRDGLGSLLGAIPGLPPLVTADSGLLALKVLRELSRSVPPGLAVPRDSHRARTASPTLCLVLIDGGLPEAEVLELLRQIKQDWPEVGCLVLAGCAAERERALAAGADQVLGVGLPAGRLYEVLQGMLEI